MFKSIYSSKKFNSFIRSLLLLSLVLGLLASTGFSVQAARNLLLTYTQVATLVSSTPTANANFGFSVAVAGDTAVVGATQANNGAGAAYIYQRDPVSNQWGYVKTLVPSSTGNGYLFGFSVAIDGDTVVVGARDDSSISNNNKNTGAVYVFSRNQGDVVNSWGQSQKITLVNFKRGDRLGTSVAIKGNLLVIGAPFEDPIDKTIMNAGSAYIYTRPDTSAAFVQMASLEGMKKNDKFGQSVATDGVSIVVGTTLANFSAQLNDCGAAYVYSPNLARTAWTLKKTLYGDKVNGENFGQSVSVSGDFVVVGAPYSGNSTLAGAAYLFSRTQGGEDNWGQVKKFMAASGTVGNQFGISVSVSGSIVGVGARSEDFGINNLNQGAAYVYARNEGGTNNWGQSGMVTLAGGIANEYFGNAVAVVGNTLIVGDSAKSMTVNAQGAAYVYDLSFPLVVDLNGGGGDTGLELTFTEGDGPLAITDPNLSISYTGHTTLDRATVQIPFVYDPGFEQLTAQPSGAILASDITYNPNTGLMTIAPLTPASISDFQDVLRTVTYQNTSNDPNTNVRVIEVSVTSGTDMSSPSVTLVNMVAVNNAPVNTLPTAQTVTEDLPLTFSGSTIQVSDVDAGINPVQVNLAITHGKLTLSQVTGLTFTVGTNDSAAFTFTGLLADVNAALNGLVYQPAANYNGADTLTINTSDLGATGSGNVLTDSDVLNITVLPVKDASFITFYLTSASGQLQAYSPFTIHYTVSSPAGIPTGSMGAVTVSVMVSGSPVTCTGALDALGQGACTMTLNKVGSMPFTAAYTGDENFLPTSNTLDFVMQNIIVRLPILQR